MHQSFRYSASVLAFTLGPNWTLLLCYSYGAYWLHGLPRQVMLWGKMLWFVTVCYACKVELRGSPWNCTVPEIAVSLVCGKRLSPAQKRCRLIDTREIEGIWGEKAPRSDLPKEAQHIITKAIIHVSWFTGLLYLIVHILPLWNFPGCE